MLISSFQPLRWKTAALCLWLSPSDVDKQILGSFVDVEDFVPEEAEAGRALQRQLPQGQGRGVAVQHRVAQDETNCKGAQREEMTEQTGRLV